MLVFGVYLKMMQRCISDGTDKFSIIANDFVIAESSPKFADKIYLNFGTAQFTLMRRQNAAVECEKHELCAEDQSCCNGNCTRKCFVSASRLSPAHPLPLHNFPLLARYQARKQSEQV